MKTIRNHQSGTALLLTMMALLILSAIAASMVAMSTTETTVNSNYRSEETAFFAARAGIYEATDRMMQSNAHSIAANLPTAIPTATNAGVLYIINQNTATGTVQPWNASNKYADTELCHEGYTIAGMANATPDVPCTSEPTGSSWYTTVSSTAPWTGTTAALPYEWVRINWKLNSSQSYLAGTTTSGVTTLASSSYSVNGGQAATTPACWDGASEVLLPTGDTNCGQMETTTTANTPVYLVTALAVAPSGAREIVQSEVALPPATVISTPAGFSDPDGFFAASSSCSTSGSSSPLWLAGSAITDGYTTANGGTYSTTHSNSLGSVGSNGSVVVSGSADVGGNIHVIHTTVNGLCTGMNPSDVQAAAGHYTGVVGINTYTPPTPTIPSPGTSDQNISSSVTLVPGNYRNVSVSTSRGVLTLAGPGTFNINCLSVGSNSTLQISPPSTQVVINVTGNNCPGNGGDPVYMDANATINNTSGIAANLMINYAGTLQLAVIGGPNAYFVLNAPNAAVKINGGSDIYGAIVATSIDDHGGTSLHFDNALTATPSNSTTSTSTSTSNYQTISFRALPY